jgi:uncharacterized protein DUF5134
MPAPPWLSWPLAAVMLAVAAYCAARLTAARTRHRETEYDADSTHVLMGVAMAGMLAPALGFLPAAAWAAVFAAAAAWFGGQALLAWRGRGSGPGRCRHPLPHATECLAMVYMLTAAPAQRPGSANGAAMPAMGATGGPGAARFPELAVIFAVFLVGYVAWLGDRIPAARSCARQAGGGRWPALAPRAAAWYKLIMGITMGYLLITML